MYDTLTKLEPLNKGCSTDKKYYAETSDGRKLLLRVSDMAEYERRKTEYYMAQKVEELGIPTCVPVEFGTCKDGVYSIYSWIEGEDVKHNDAVLPGFSEDKQYTFGLKAGEILRKIHSIPAPENRENWGMQFSRKLDGNLQNYLGCGLRFEGDEYILTYIEKNRHLLKGRPESFIHG
ncbi:MAG: phosphotransferase, partial [Clostridiales bacterium]|nr:phosphotransferase [Clostridiales bacterium]